MGKDEKSDQIKTFPAQIKRKEERQKEREKVCFGIGTNGTLDGYVRIEGPIGTDLASQLETKHHRGSM